MATTKPSSTADEGGGRGTGVEKRWHPTSTRHSGPGATPYDREAVDDSDAGGEGSAKIFSHISKGGRFSDRGERMGTSIVLLPEAGPDCRALVPYSASPARSRLPPPAHPSLLALPPSLGCDSPSLYSSCSLSSCDCSSSSPNGAFKGGVARRVDIPLEVFPIAFQARGPAYMDALTLCTVSSVSREWKRQGNDDQYWSRLCRSRFNVIPDAFAPPPDPIKRLYQLQHGSFKAMCRGDRRHGLHSGAPPVIPRHTSAQLLMGLLVPNAT
ncbi:unnamed protein product [Ectocarpus sp. 12 AP-2014]